MSSRFLRFLVLLPLWLSCCQAPAPVVRDVGWNPSPAILEWSDELVARLQIATPVVVRDAPILQEGLFGRTYPARGFYLIELEVTLDPKAKLMVLMHELAHVLVMEQGDWSGDHGEAWGVASSRVYQAMIGENRGFSLPSPP